MSKKRPSGDGLIRKRSDGRWEGRIIVGRKQDGKFIYHSVFVKTQKELLPKLDDLCLRYGGVVLTEKSAVTVGDWLDKWMSEYKQGVIRASTYASYKSEIETHIKPYLGSKMLTKIKTADVQKLYNTLSEQWLAPATVRGVHMILHASLACALKEGLLPKDPTEGASPPKIQRKEMRVLSKSEIGIFMKQLEGDKFWHDLFYTELLTGMRRGELCGFRWEDFDEQKGTLKVARSVKYLHGKLVIGETKTEDGKRVIYLPESLKRMLADKRRNSISEWVFPNMIDPSKPVRPDSAYLKLKSTLKAAGLSDIRFHDLRHTFASHAANAGIPSKTLSEIVGHSKASFTLDTYAPYDEKGLPKTKNVLAKTKRECSEKLKKLKAEVGATDMIKCSSDMTFGKWMEYWYRTYCKNTLKEYTQKTYEQRIYKQIIPKIGHLPLNKITTGMLERFYTNLKNDGRLVRREQNGNGLSDSVIRSIHAHCRAALCKKQSMRDLS